MKYYIAAVLGKESNNYVNHIQRRVCKKFKLYRNNARLHIILEVADGPNDLQKVFQIIESVIKPYKKFKVLMDNNISCDGENKTVNIKIEDKGYIIRLARQISEKLKIYGFNTKGNINNINLNIKLGNMGHNTKENSKVYIDDKEDNKIAVLVEKIDVMKSQNGKSDSILKSFTLREF